MKTIESSIILYNKQISDVRLHEISLDQVAEAVQKKKGEDSGDDDFGTDNMDEAAFASENG